MNNIGDNLDDNKSKEEFKVNFIFNENGLTLMHCIEENYIRYVKNFK